MLSHVLSLFGLETKIDHSLGTGCETSLACKTAVAATAYQSSRGS
jgi:hypothetical protein